MLRLLGTVADVFRGAHRGARRPPGPLPPGARGGAATLVTALTTALATGLVSGCTRPPADDAPPTAASSPSAAATAPTSAAPTSTAPPPSSLPATFTLVAAGDVLPHGPVLRSATGDAGEVDFSPLLAGLDPWVEGADLALCHLEVPIAPRGTAPSGYPVFGAPAPLVRDLAEQGWDGCSTASNHALDRGFPGVRTTLRRLDAAGMGHAGTARTAAEQKRPQLYRLRREGRLLTVAHLSATYGLNGMPVPDDAPWAVALIDAGDLVDRARAARRDGADVVLVSLHAGSEYTETLTDQQRDVVRRLARSGQVDLVIGHHAHVPQRIARVGRGPGGDGMWVAYGLGNMLSNQSAECCDARTSNGVLLSATFRQEHAWEPVRVADVGWTGTTVDIAAGHRVHALPDLGDAPGRAPGLSAGDLSARRDAVAGAVGDAADRRTAPPSPTGPAPDVVPRGGR